MTSSLDYLRRQAKTLKRAFNDGDPAAAAARVRAVWPAATVLKHADALHVIAREQGHASWPKLKFTAEHAGLDRSARIDRLRRALFHGRRWAVDELLTTDPTLATADLGLAAALYEEDAVRAALARDPAAATGEIDGRRPILHLAFSRHLQAAPEKKAAMLAVAEALVAAGADVNDGFPFEPGGEHLLSALYGALGHADNMPLAAWLLAKGANPNDNESLYHSTELGHRDGLELLLRHGAAPAGTNALARALDFDDLEAARLLLDAGADPNEGVVPHPSGESPLAPPSLHQAARRMCSGAMAELLIAYGANGAARVDGHTAYALARMRGNQAVADVLAAAGQATALDANEALLAAAAEGAADGRIDPAALSAEARRIMTRILHKPGALAHLQRLAAIGVDPNWTEEMGLPAAHVAGWEGHAPELEWLLGLGPDLDHVNAYGGDLLGTALHGADNCPARETRDHVTCVRLILDAGASFTRKDIDACGDEAVMALLLERAEARPDQLKA